MSKSRNVIKSSFFTALKTAFAFPGGFGELRYQSVWRTLLHLTVFCVLVSLLAGGIKFRRMEDKIAPVLEILGKNFGALIVTPSSVTPENEPEKGRSVEIFNGFYLVYYPRPADKLQLPPGAQNVVFWLPKSGMLSGTRLKDGNWSVGLFDFEEMSEAEVPEYLNRNLDGGNRLFGAVKLPEGADEKEYTQRFTPESLHSGVFRNLLFTANVLGYFFRYMLFSLLCVSLFSTVFYLTRRSCRLSMREVWVMGVYASLPGLFVGSLFSALDLPLLSDGMVYVIALACYFPFIAAKEEVQDDK